MDVSWEDNSAKKKKKKKMTKLAIPNQISTITMHIPSLVKIHWYLLKLSSGNENIDVSRADKSIKKWWNLPISNPKPDLYNINAHTKFGYLSYRSKTKIRTDLDRQKKGRGGGSSWEEVGVKPVLLAQNLTL